MPCLAIIFVNCGVVCLSCLCGHILFDNLVDAICFVLSDVVALINWWLFLNSYYMIRLGYWCYTHCFLKLCLDKVAGVTMLWLHYQSCFNVFGKEFFLKWSNANDLSWKDDFSLGLHVFLFTMLLCITKKDVYAFPYLKSYLIALEPYYTTTHDMAIEISATSLKLCFKPK